MIRRKKERDTKVITERLNKRGREIGGSLTELLVFSFTSMYSTASLQTNNNTWEVVVAQSVERSLLTPEVRG